MTIRIALLAWALCAGAAQAQTTLAWKFAKGDVFDIERIATQKQTVEINGKEFKQERTGAWQVRLEVKDKQPAGFVILATLTKVEHRLVGGMDRTTLDPQLDEKMQGAAFTLLVTGAGRIAEMQGYEDFLSKLADKDKKRLPALRNALPEAALKEALGDLFGPLPDKAVTTDTVWQREYLEPIAHFGSLRSTARYVYRGQSEERDLIDYMIETKYEAPTEGMVPFRIVKGSIASEKGRGRIAFDGAAGRLLEHERSMVLRGMLTIEAMERQQPLEFTSVNEVKVRVKD